MTVFLNQALARRFEGDMLNGNQKLLESLREISGNQAIQALEAADGAAIYGGLESPLNEAVGMGMKGPVDEQALHRIEEFYASKGSPAVIRVCPLCHPSLLELTQKHGYSLTGFSNRWVLDLSTWQSPFPSPDSRVRRALPADESAWAQAVGCGFADVDASESNSLYLERAFFKMKGSVPVAGIENGRIAAGGIVTVANGLVSLFAASTLPFSRNRGLQTALLDWRLRFGKEHGAEIATVETDVDSGSQRNIERMGFRLAYTATQLQKTLPMTKEGGKQSKQI